MIFPEFNVLESSLMSRRAIPISPPIISFILENIEGFDVMLEEGERIVITPKEHALVKPTSRNHLRDLLNSRSSATPALRPKLIYCIVDSQLTPERLKKSGMSVPRLAVYGAIFHAGEKGIDNKTIREKTKLSPGNLSGVLFWLQRQKLIIAKPAPVS